jgi:hypothetical protein
MTKRKPESHVTTVTTAPAGASASDKRQYPRYELPMIKVRLGDDEAEHDLIDVSSEGVFVGTTEGAWESGAPVKVTLRVPLMNKISPLEIDGQIIRQTPRGLAIHYRTPNRTWPRVLRVLDIKTK